MIFGNIYKPMLEEQFAVLPAPLRNAIRFLKDNDMAAHEPGVFNIELDGLPIILQVLDLETKGREDLRPEIHRKNIDVQFLAKGGPEEAGFYSKEETGRWTRIFLTLPGTFFSFAMILKLRRDASAWFQAPMPFISLGMSISPLSRPETALRRSVRSL